MPSTLAKSTQSTSKATCGVTTAVLRQLLAKEAELEETLIMAGSGTTPRIVEMQIGTVREQIKSMQSQMTAGSQDEEDSSSLSSLSGSESEHAAQSSDRESTLDKVTTKEPTIMQKPAVHASSGEPLLMNTTADSPRKRSAREHGPGIRSSKRLRKDCPSPTPEEAKELAIPTHEKSTVPIPGRALRKGARALRELPSRDTKKDGRTTTKSSKGTRTLRELPSRDTKKDGRTTTTANTGTPSTIPLPARSPQPKAVPKTVATAASSRKTKTPTEGELFDKSKETWESDGCTHQERRLVTRSLIEEDEKGVSKKPPTHNACHFANHLDRFSPHPWKTPGHESTEIAYVCPDILVMEAYNPQAGITPPVNTMESSPHARNVQEDAAKEGALDCSGGDPTASMGEEKSDAGRDTNPMEIPPQQNDNADATESPSERRPPPDNAVPDPKPSTVELPKEKCDADKVTNRSEISSQVDAGQTVSEISPRDNAPAVPERKEQQVREASGQAVGSPSTATSTSAPTLTTAPTSTTPTLQQPGPKTKQAKRPKKDGPSRQKPSGQSGTGTRSKPAKKGQSGGKKDGSGDDDDLEIVDRNLLDAEIMTCRAVQDYLIDPRDENRLTINARVHIKAAAGHCPEAATSCWELARDCLVTKRGQIKCIYHLLVDRSRKWDKTEDGLKGIPYEPTPPMTVQEDSATGSYERLRVPRGKDFEPYCHCGCRLEDAIWGLYLWKTGSIAYHGKTDRYDVPPTPAQQNFEITRLKSLGIELDDLWTHVRTDNYYRKRTDDELLDLRLRRILQIKKGKGKDPEENSPEEDKEGALISFDD
ncbi:hypothetical protein PQX77_016047 [Marasmius sp. AFHP31]|nr:hypothetical protein PQX77_016047 [Marasmius sp. AFHP31]